MNNLNGNSSKHHEGQPKSSPASLRDLESSLLRQTASVPNVSRDIVKDHWGMEFDSILVASIHPTGRADPS
jgi:hypothetical protein